MCEALDLRPKILEKTIKEEVTKFDHLSPEELLILIEEYCHRALEE